ncbi:MAG: glycosyltransferase [Spirochaetia bacterium]|nr:glycosyltransferase [Spirochaetia bacterium]
MKALFVSHSSVLSYHQQKLELLAKNHDMEVHLAMPASWPEGGHTVAAQTKSTLIKYHTGKTFTVRGLQHFYADAGNILDAARPDIIQIEEEPYSLACGQFIFEAKKRSIPAIFFTWENIDRRYNHIYTFLDRYSIKNCAAAVAGNAEGARILKKKRPKMEIVIIPQYGINAEDFVQKASVNTEGRLKVAYAGRLTPEKGIESLIDAVAGCGNMSLTIAGTGSAAYTAALQAKAAEEMDAGTVTFAGFLDRDGINDLYNECDVLVLPSLTTPKWKEQFGRVLVEAMACGTAVIGSDSGEIKNVIDGAGLVFRENDIDDLMQKLRMLDRDRELLKTLSTAGIKRSADFTNIKIASSLAELFGRVLKKAGANG